MDWAAKEKKPLTDILRLKMLVRSPAGIPQQQVRFDACLTQGGGRCHSKSF